ncbi:MAG: class II glutamine amidotransferase, partial [Polyangiaceae bacterium]
VFHVCLSFLHDGGILNEGLVDASLVREALRSSLAVLDGTTAEVGAPPAELNVMVSSGSYIVALHRSGAKMSLRILSGKADADALIGEDAQLRGKTPEIARMHFTIAASDFDDAEPGARWKAVPDRAIVTMSRDADPRIEAL